MEKRDEVKETIIAQALYLFNTKGIALTSIQDIMEATGLPKGSIYRRFANKEAIVLAAFEKAGQVIGEHFARAAEQADSAIDKLLAIAAIYQDAVHNPPIPGGCPMLNTAIESDGTFPELQKRAAEAYQATIRLFQSIIEEGIRRRELRPELNAYALASYLVSSMEGAIMASRLTSTNEHVLYNMEYTKMLLLSYRFVH
ncbi:MAG: putative TetR family transcriptional regulator [Paenibacillus sp.]|jgi:AcrR family transcriptional regulator|nr:putative TetR family transcriptional regulator [Paenibacillus sp.]